METVTNDAAGGSSPQKILCVEVTYKDKDVDIIRHVTSTIEHNGCLYVQCEGGRNLTIAMSEVRKYDAIPMEMSKKMMDDQLLTIGKSSKIEAIKAYRAVTGAMLKEAKDYIDKLLRERGSE